MAEHLPGVHFLIFGPPLTFSLLVPGEAVFDLPLHIAHVFMAEHLPRVHFLIFGPTLMFLIPVQFLTSRDTCFHGRTRDL
jgi:hypothetical protein